MKKSKKSTQQQSPKRINIKKLVLVSFGFLLLVFGLLGLGWYLGQNEANYDPYQELENFHYSRHQYLVKSAEVSVKMANKAIAELKKKNVKQAIKDCKNRY